MEKELIFLAGHHRSGTSLLHRIIRDHPAVSGFQDTGAPQDEGQHLQTIFEPARTYGGPGKYIFDKNAYMDESHPLATPQTAQALLEQWEAYLDKQKKYYVEKSPPTLIRTRFFQRLFPRSRFVVILRHPVAVACATQKWSKTSLQSLLEHTLRGYEIFAADLPQLQSAFVFRYEELVEQPHAQLDLIYDFLGLEPQPIGQDIDADINEHYFLQWEAGRRSLLKGPTFKTTPELEARANRFGYSFSDLRTLLPTRLDGAVVGGKRKD